VFRARGNPLSARGEVANGRYRWVVLAVSVVAQATFLGAVFQGLPVLGPVLRSAYGLSLGQLGLVLSSVAVGILITLLAWGAAADRFGERRVMVLGLLGAAVALLVAAQTSDAFGLAAALLVAGACGASVNAAGGRAVMGWFAFRERGLAMGIRQTALPLGAAVAAVSLPVLSAVGGVDGALLALAACCALAAASVAIWIREPPMVGAGRAAEGADKKSSTRNTKIWRLAAAGGLLAVPQFGVVAFLVIFLHEERGYAVGTAAGFLAAVQLLGGAARILVGRWSDLRRRRVGPLRKLGLATTLGFIVTSALVGAPDPVLLPALLATSILAASWNGLANTVAAELAAPGRSGTAIGFYSTVMGAGASIAPPAFAGVVTATSSWANGFVAVAACSLLGVVVLAPLACRELAGAPSEPCKLRA
jgi:sugar phosphate permease